jgi:two-component system response regulator AtoC
MAKPSILVVDDDESIRRYLSVLLSSLGYAVATVASADEALVHLGAEPLPALILLDLVMPGVGGLELLESLKQAYPQVPVMILSTIGEIRTVVEAMKRGAVDYLTKPFEEEELELAVTGALEKHRLREEVNVLKRRLDQYGDPPGLVSSNPQMLRIREIAGQVAASDAPVLILGETGVGKEVLARSIHSQSGRRGRAFVKVNCAALPHELLESELFGYEKGAFSGAIRDKPGKFELAHKGSILLDEIAEMSPHLQAKLLHVLQDGEFSRLGARQTTRVDARILASTNKPLDKIVGEGTFREDLFFRLAVVKIEIPPLRERREDIPLLAGAFVQRYADAEGGGVQELPSELIEAFLRHDWPGNVRELENAVRRYLILPDLEMAVTELMPSRRPVPPRPSADLKQLAHRAADQAEREAVRRVLAETRWNRRQAARRLNISYKALLNKLKKWEAEESGESGESIPAGEKAARRGP